jgi:hypothetical protein
MAHDYVDLFTVISPKLAGRANYCGKLYWLWEDCVAAPALAAAGYRLITFHMGEHDSFGPLTRVVRCRKDGQTYEFIYG